MAQQLRIGIIGAGSNTRKMHLPGFQAIEGVEVVSVCNRTEESSRAVAEAFSIPEVAYRWQDVVNNSEVDAVCIGTWPYLHAEASIAALEQGKHVLCEARMARNLSEAKAMLRAAQDHPECVAQVVPAPFSLDFDDKVAAIVADGTLGELREVCVTHAHGAYADSSAPMTWRQDYLLSGCNILSLGIYHETIQRWVSDRLDWVMADGEIFTRNRPDPENGEMQEVEIPDSISVLGRYESGARLVYHVSGVETGRGRNRVCLNGSRACLRIEMKDRQLWLTEVGAADKEQPVSFEATPQNGWRVEEDFVESIREGKPVTRTSFEDGLRYMRFVERVWRSWTHQGKPFDGEGD